MGRKASLLVWLLILVAVVAGEGSISKGTCHASRSVINLKHYCEGWRVNVELNNIRGFDAVPGECADHVGKYMTSAQYGTDVRRASYEAVLFLANKFAPGGGGDGKDAWVFDIDDTLLSTLPYYKKHHFGAVVWCGGDAPNRFALERWMEEGEAPALEHILDLYYDIKRRGLKIFIISSRGEHMRDATVHNLLKVGYSGWTKLILRCDGEASDGVEEYKAEQRQKLVENGYRIWGIMGDQWSSIGGHPSAKRTFKLPNPMYYHA